MPEFFSSALTMETVKWEEVAMRLVAALFLGRLVALVYTWTRLENERTPSFPATLVLLTVLIAMVTQAIGNNVARAFSLVGTLSIVRFRTIVRDTVDTAFVIFAVIVGMAIGASNLAVAVLGLIVTTVAAFWMRSGKLQGPAESAPLILKVRSGLGHDLNTLAGPTLDAELAGRRLLSLGTAKQGTVLEASYEIRLKKGTSADVIVRALNRLEGIQSVEVVSPDVDDEDD